jgi:hypothetical protein
VFTHSLKENYLMILQPDVIYPEIRSESSEITACLSTTVGRITGGQLRKSQFEGFELLVVEPHHRQAILGSR